MGTMAHQSTRPFSASITSSPKLLLHRCGCNAAALSPKMTASLRRSRRCSTVVAQSNPVAEVQKTL